jgi:D-alanine-D-alanine ligase-like ATP-grasp enzyme
MEHFNVALLFGGVSSEHDISCMSAQTFLTVMDTDDAYTVYPIYISRSGEWFLYDGDRKELKEAPNGEYTVPVAVMPGLGSQALLALTEEGPQTL